MLLVHRWAVVLVLLALAGCTVDTTEPLSDPVTTAPDVSLYGHWVQKDATSEIHAFIGKHTTKDNPNSIMEIVKITRNTDDKQIEAGPTGYFTVSRVGNTSYMNLLAEKGDSKLSLSQAGSYAKWAKNDKKRCAVRRYKCDGMKLQVWTAKTPREALKKLSEAGEVKMIDEVVTADSLVRYLQKAGGEVLFNELLETWSKVP